MNIPSLDFALGEDINLLRDAVKANASAGCDELHAAIRAEVSAFTADAPQTDDLTLVVIEYQPE